VRLIDVHHLGVEHVIGSWLVDGVLVDPGPGSTVDTLLAELGDERPRVIAVTHIHLDHAGATGALVQRWPDVEVWVHERGAPHLADPSKLLKSASRLYGEDMDRLWGDTVPVPRDRLRILGDSDELDAGFRSAYTPGHASHHVSYLHEPSGMAFTGDAGGVRVGDGPPMAPTPPPDVDVEAWRATLDLIERWDPDAIAPTHFGRHENVRAHLDGVRAYLDDWARRARDLEQDRWIAAWRADIGDRASEVAAYEQAMPPSLQWMGLDRYWSLAAQK
jgi:glyoxylase-like metal-dependent hydrolase (beta-lactamase superfamily II)